jgi:hypothetical protein
MVPVGVVVDELIVAGAGGVAVVDANGNVSGAAVVDVI